MKIFTNICVFSIKKNYETNYKRLKKLTKFIKIAERYHYQKEFDKHKSDLKKMWQIIRGIIGKKTSCHHSKTKNS